jgi:hypothetical protein
MSVIKLGDDFIKVPCCSGGEYLYILLIGVRKLLLIILSECEQVICCCYRHALSWPMQSLHRMLCIRVL